MDSQEKTDNCLILHDEEAQRSSGASAHEATTYPEQMLHELDAARLELERLKVELRRTREAEAYREMAREVLLILNDHGSLEELIPRVLTALKTRTGFDAVGIRLQDGDDFPYFHQQGFSEDFLLSENLLKQCSEEGGICPDTEGNACLECSCGLVISGKTDPDNPLFTVGGSCWTNDSFALLDLAPETDPRLNPRNECMHQGFASVALVPVRDGGRIVGLIQFNGRRKDCFTLDMVERLEEIARHIGAALMRKRVEEEKLAFQQQCQEAQKLESLGVLAGGIAHDFNNLLTIIMGHCSLAKMDSSSTERSLCEIEKASERAAELCRLMLAYAGKPQFVSSQVDLKALVNEMVAMLKSTLKQNATIRLDVSPDNATIKGDASQLRQIIVNLIVNASEAIGEDRGELRVSLAGTDIRDGQPVKDHLGKAIASGCYACLEVSDTGCGMDRQTAARVFEPFFSTKFTGRGLGLSATLGIVTSHGGAVQLSSHPGLGATFKVYLPMQNGANVTVEPCTAVPAPWLGSGAVLLVEDEEQVRLVAKRGLQVLGFKVIEATNGREALELYGRYAVEITLVLTDLGMPFMDGYQLFRELKKLDPKLPIIICSGFGDDDVRSQIAEEEMAGLLRKPYKFQTLQETLRSALS